MHDRTRKATAYARTNEIDERQLPRTLAYLKYICTIVDSLYILVTTKT